MSRPESKTPSVSELPYLYMSGLRPEHLKWSKQKSEGQHAPWMGMKRKEWLRKATVLGCHMLAQQKPTAWNMVSHGTEMLGVKVACIARDENDFSVGMVGTNETSLGRMLSLWDKPECFIKSKLSLGEALVSNCRQRETPGSGTV